MNSTPPEKGLEYSYALFCDWGSLEQRLHRRGRFDPMSFPGEYEEIDLAQLGAARVIATRVAKIGAQLSATQRLETLFETIVDKGISFLSADGGALFIVEESQLKIKSFVSRSLELRFDSGKSEKFPLHSIPIDRTSVVGRATLDRKTINIPNLHSADLEGELETPKKFDRLLGYDTRSTICSPMFDQEGRVIGALQMVNALDAASGAIGPFPPESEILLELLANQAAINIINSQLLREAEMMFNSLLKVINIGLDERSAHTSGHVERVASMTMELARMINQATRGPFAMVNFSDANLKELWVAGWLHDMGKIVSPSHIMDKSRKLERLCDGIELIEERFKTLAERMRADAFKKIADKSRDRESSPEVESAILAELDAALAGLDEELRQIRASNEPGERMSQELLDRIRRIGSSATPEGFGPKLTDSEIAALTIRSGSLTAKERKIMMDHIVVTKRLLAKIHFPKEMKNAPLYAGSHHESLDGSGYPEGLNADQMPLQSRMLAVIDQLEALTASDRPYKKSLSYEEALAILTDQAEKGKLDRDIVEILKTRNILQGINSRRASNPDGIDPYLSRLD